MPQRVSVPEEWPTAEKEVKISSAAGRFNRLTTGRLNWPFRAQDRKAALMSMVSARRSAVKSFKCFAKGWSVLPEKRKPASTPHRKSSPLGVKPVPNPRSRISFEAASWYLLQ